MGAALDSALGAPSAPTSAVAGTPRPTMDQLEAACMASILEGSLQRLPSEAASTEAAVAVVTTHHLFLTPEGAPLAVPDVFPPQPLAQVLVPGLPFGGVALTGGPGRPAISGGVSSVATRVEYLNLTPSTTWVPGWDVDSKHVAAPGATQHPLPAEVLEAAGLAAAARWRK